MHILLVRYQQNDFSFTLCSLFRSQISNEGAFALAGALQVNQSLQTLKWVQTLRVLISSLVIYQEFPNWRETVNVYLEWPVIQILTVIAVVCWLKIVSLVLKLTLGVELWALLYSCRLPLLEQSLQLLLEIQFSGKAHENSYYSVMTVIMHWHLCAKTHPGGKVVSAVIIFCLPLAAIACWKHDKNTT